MNKVIMIGRLTKDPELKTTTSGVSITSFTVAVNRRFKNADGNYDADFINCVAWRQQAEFICKHFGKGSLIGLEGSIQTRNYDNKDGQKVYVTEVAVDGVEFVGGKQPSKNEPEFGSGFLPIDNNDDVPF